MGMLDGMGTQPGLLGVGDYAGIMPGYAPSSYATNGQALRGLLGNIGQSFTGMAQQGLQQQQDFLQGLDPNSGQPAVTPGDRLNVLAHWFTNNMGPQSVGGLLGGGEGALGAGPIRAFHGSPYNFDKFDLSKIGTGEGAQAYGHGLYFAGNENVARTYRDALSYNKLASDPANDVVKYWIETGGGDKMKGAAAYRDFARQSGIPQAEADRFAGLIEKQPGTMYEVNLHADPAALLDWDKPIANQPAFGAVQSLVDPDMRKTFDFNAAHGISGANAYTNYIPTARLSSGNQYMLGSAAVSRMLREAGIPGLQYLDAGSRGAANGTHNYVMFDPNLIEILRKYGIGGLTAGAGGAGLLNQDY